MTEAEISTRTGPAVVCALAPSRKTSEGEASSSPPKARPDLELEWVEYDPARHRVYEVEVRLVAEVDAGGLSVCVPQLPGVVSAGETEQEALASIREALAGALKCYTEAGEPIPWVPEVTPKAAGEQQRWVVVHA
jgi:predicted RNase H-like HicB family nuclease